MMVRVLFFTNSSTCYDAVDFSVTCNVLMQCADMRPSSVIFSGMCMMLNAFALWLGFFFFTVAKSFVIQSSHQFSTRECCCIDFWVEL